MAPPRPASRVLGPGEPDEGRVVRVVCGERSICVARVRGRVGAVEDACPHRGASLSGGRIRDGRLECPVHGWQFDPFDGTLPGGFSSGLRAHHVEEREDGVYVEVDALPRGLG